MRRWALVLGGIGVVLGIVAVFLGVTGVNIDVPEERTYDCGSAFGRLGGDEAEIQWRGDTDLFLIDNPDLSRDDLPTRACKDSTDDRLVVVGVVGGLGAVLVIAGVVAFLLSFRGQRPPPAASTEPAAEPAT
jgi:hypothetical protein